MAGVFVVHSGRTGMDLDCDGADGLHLGSGGVEVLLGNGGSKDLHQTVGMLLLVGAFWPITFHDSDSRDHHRGEAFDQTRLRHST